ncbi:hypothetical protein LR69_01096 [Geobacillus sp. BCO2]|nr:hypothetical protein LR69_01096 [Geobacillus sp. BCO2]
MQQRYATAFMLILWELFINTKAHINTGILYSLLGDFEKAKAALDERWLMFYVAIYMYSIWDSYRGSVDMNKLYLLADREDAPISSIRMGIWDINYLDKREPWLALVWSVLAPGLGHLYVHKVITGLFIFTFTILVSYFAHLPEAITYTLTPIGLCNEDHRYAVGALSAIDLFVHLLRCLRISGRIQQVV